MSDASGFPAVDRRSFLGTTLALGTAAALGAHGEPAMTGSVPPLEDATLAELHRGLEEGRFTSRELVVKYLARINALDQMGPRLRSVIETNPDALAIAEERDAQRKAKTVHGPLHGIPILVKDNLDTADRMKTTAGSLALEDAPAPARDAFVVQRLREAGAVLLGKTNLSEWANMRSTRSTSGWSGRGGQTRNPFALDRNPSGSSSGSAVAVAAGLCAAAIGTETDGSIVSPSNACGIVGLKPTVGLLSRSGIIPISHSQDTAGPMARTVRDAALLLDALAGEDPRDRATRNSARPFPDYTRGLDPGALKGARLGLVKNLLGSPSLVDPVLAQALDVLRRQGAVLVDVEHRTSDYDAAELEVLLHEYKADLEAYLGARGGKVRDLAGLIAFNEQHKDREMPFFGQELLLQAQARGPVTSEAYLKAVETCRKGAAQGLDQLMDQHKLDALVAPTGAPAWLTDPILADHYGFSCSTPTAVAGYPHLTVPMGFVQGLPVNLSFFGRAWSEALLLRLGHAFEQATRARRAPRFPATVTP